MMSEIGRSITDNPSRPTMDAVRHQWCNNKDVDDDFLKGQFDYQALVWDKFYAQTSPEKASELTNAVLATLDFDWSINDAEEAFENQFGSDCLDSMEDVFRAAIRPWPEGGWTGVEVGNVKFGETPADFYRLLFLCKPKALDFDDMYGCGLFGIVSPCGRFAMQFYFHKYELAAYQLVVEDLAVRTRPERTLSIHCGIPGTDNGVATTDADANQWFLMVYRALKRKWGVYLGNDFEV